MDFDPSSLGAVEAPSSTARPVFQAGSTSGAPHGTPDDDQTFDPAKAGAKLAENFDPAAAGATPADEPFDPAKAGAQLANPDDIKAKVAADSSYVPSNNELQTLFDAEKNRTLGDKAVGVVKGAGNAIATTAKNAYGSIGELLRKPDIEQSGRLASTALEGISDAAAGTVKLPYKLVKGPLSYLGHAIQDSFDPTGQDDREFARWKEDYLQNLAQSRTSNSEEFQKTIGIDQPFKPLPQAASTLSLALQIAAAKAPAIGATGAASDAAKLAAAGSGTDLASAAIENNGAAVPQTPLEAGASAVSGAAAQAGQTAETLAAAPGNAARNLVSKAVGPEMADKAVKAGTLAATIKAPILGVLPAVEAAGTALKNAGNIAKSIADTPAAGPFGRLVNLAKSPNTPDWLKNLASMPAVKSLYNTASAATTGAVGAAQGIAKGAALGAGIGVVSGDSPEELGGDIAAFGAFGAAHGADAVTQRTFARRSAAVMDLVGKNLADGVAPETLAKVPNSAMLAAADIPYLGIKDAQGRDLQVRFAADKDMGQQGVDGSYDSVNHVLTLNADYLAKSKSSWSSIFHELLHPLAESDVANKPEVSGLVDDAVQRAGKTLDQAKYSYVYSLLKPELAANGIKDPIEVNKAVAARVAQFDSDSVARTGDASDWVRSELLSEAGRHALGTSEGINSPEGAIANALKGPASSLLQGTLEKLGVNFKKPTQLAGTVIPGFENVAADPSMRSAVYKLLKAQRDAVPGSTKTESTEQGRTLAPADMGTAKAPFYQLPNGKTGNKYSEVVPDGKGGQKTVMRNPGQVRKAERAEAAAIKKHIKPGQRLDKLPAAFYSDPNIGEWTKQAARTAEASATSGESLEGWYHGIAKAGAANWRASAKKVLGNVLASHQQFFVMPNGMHVSKAGNALMDVFSNTAFNRKAQSWLNRSGPLSLERWGGDINAFRNDVNTYNKNHAANLPGESNNLGPEKRDVINAFLFGRNAQFEARNPLRKTLRSAEDRQGVVRSLRLDRLETLQPSTTDLSRPDYPKGVKNFSPEAPEDTTSEVNRVSTLTPAQQTAYFKQNQSRVDNQAYRVGQAAKSPADVAALEQASDAAMAKSKTAKASGDWNTAIEQQTISQHWREAHEAATGTGSAGKTLRDANPGYKAPVPMDEAQSITSKRADAAAQAVVDKAATEPRPQFSPKAAKKGGELEHTVGDEKIPVVHLSSATTLKTVDPKYFGKGRANTNDQRGAPKSYFFVKGSPLGGDEPIFGQGGYNAHVGEVNGNKVYDLTKGKPDPLGYFRTINREEADDNLKDAGYDGVRVDAGDGRKVVMMYKPVKVSPAGAFEGNKANAKKSQFSPEAPSATRIPNEDVRKSAADYAATAGLTEAPHTGYAPLNESNSRKTADFYQAAQHNPEDPKVKASYDALKTETVAQFKHAEAAGIKFEPWTKEGQPYKNSAEMSADVRDNKHLYYFPTDQGFGTSDVATHPMLEKSGIKDAKGNDIPVNDAFRAVHDLYGHAKEGYEFGPRGEKNAFLTHSKMFSEAAQPAMAAETHGQNSWVNFGSHLRDESGNIPAKGEAGYIKPQDRPFAEQKATVLPPDLLKESKSVPVQYSPKTAYGKALERDGYKFDTSDFDFGTGMFSISITDPDGHDIASMTTVQTGPKTAKVEMVTVATASQRKGIGQALYRETGRILQERGITELHGNVVNPEAVLPLRKKVFGEDSTTAVARSPYAQDVTTKVDPNRVFSPKAVEHIRAAAARIDKSKVFEDLEHHSAFFKAQDAIPELTEDDFLGPRHEEGFVTSKGRFVDRDEAFKIASKNKQINASQDPVAAKEGWLEAGSLGKPGQFSPEAPKVDDKEAARYAGRIASATERTGGTTFNIADGKPVGKGKVFGVSIYPDRSVILDPKDLTADRVKQFIHDNADLLTNPENAVGTWLDKESGKVYLDVSSALKDRALAEYAGFKYNQKAVWDSEKGEEISTGGTGTPPEHLPPAADRIALLKQEHELQNPKTGQTQIPGMGHIVLDPKGDEMKNVRDLEMLRPDRELTPNEQAASDLARKEVKQRVQLLPDVDSRVKVRTAIQKGVAEVSEFLDKQATNKNFDSGKDWYGEDIRKMEDTTKLLFPETKSPEKMTMFKLLLAAFSGGATPKLNYQLASEAFAQYLKTGEVPATSEFRVSETGAKRKLGRQSEMTAEKLSGLLEKTGGEAGFVKYLTTKHGETIGGNKDAYGALDLGPKFGRFFLNLMGHQNEVTIDLWATRTWRRWMGTPFARVQEAPGVSKMAMPDIPSDTERNEVLESFKQIAKHINNELPENEHLTPMSVQAMLWFYEKDLYASRGVRVDRGSFSEGAKDYAANPVHKREAPVVTGQKAKVDPNQKTFL